LRCLIVSNLSYFKYYLKMSFAFHKELVKNSSVDHILTGNFIDGGYSRSQSKNYSFHQVLIVRKNRFEVYDINSDDSTYTYLLEYKVFGEIVKSEKMRQSGRQKDIVILTIDYAKIVFLEYDETCADFKILCLYNLENENLSNGKKFYTQAVQLVNSETYGSVLIMTNEVNITVLLKKDQVDYEMVLGEEDQIRYIDTINGENYFEPSFYVNLREHGVLRIIKFFVTNKENEILDYADSVSKVKDDCIVLQLLYVDGPSADPDKQVNSGTLFMKNKVCLALVYISKSSKNVLEFKMLSDDLDEHSFDLFCLTSSRMIVVLSPYVIQYVNSDSKQCQKIVLNNIYIAVLNNHKKVDNLLAYPNSRHDFVYAQLNIDLRGGGYLILSQTMFLFSDSKGSLYLFSFNVMDKPYSIDSIFLTEGGQPVYSLNSPYQFITMPNPGLFLLGSYHGDVIYIQYTSSNEYLIVNRMLNLSPIITFSTLQNSIHPSYNNIKFVMTSGYDKNAHMNFLFDKLTADIVSQKETQEVGYMKSLRLEGSYTKYLVTGLTNGLTAVLNANLDEITEATEINKTSKLLHCYSLYGYIVCIFDKSIEVYDSEFKLLKTFDFKTIDSADIVKQAKHSLNTIVLSTYNEKMYSITIDFNNEILFHVNSIMINSQSGKVLTFTVNSKLINDTKFLLLYRENNSLEVYNLDNQGMVFKNELISELPVIVSDTSVEENLKDFEKSISDISTSLIINNNTYQMLYCHSSPEEIFFDHLGTKTVFSMTFTNGTVVFYEVFFVDGNMRMKKFYSDFIENIDYRDFFYSVRKSINS
jgi:hypothetical protein